MGKVYVSGKLCGTIPKGTKKNTWYEVTCNLTGNEIKLVTTQNTYLSIQGFEAYAGTAAIAIPTPVVAKGPQHLVKIDESLVSQSSPYSKNRFPATNAFHNKFTHTNKGKGMWWKVKFPVKYNFSKIRIKNRANCCPDRLDLTKVYVSGKLCGTIPKGTKKNTWYEVTCNLTGNEIKLVTTQNTYLSIQGFEAYAGAAAIATTPVVAQGPQHLVKINESLVSQASPYSNNRFPATNAFHNKFTHTNKGVGMWLKVKFPVNYNFSKIRIKNRANCCPERLDLTKVYVSGQLCGT